MSDPIELLDNSDLEVQDITLWDVAVKSEVPYKDAYEIFKGRKYSVPNNDALKNLLVSFKDQPGKDFFAAGPRRLQFRDVTEQLKASYKPVKSQRDKQWKKEYNAQKLAFLVFLICREELERKHVAVAASVATCGTKKKGGGPAEMADLRRAVIKFEKVYEPCLAKHVEFVKAEANKKFRTPLLDY